jgi:N-acetyl-gamma-glutamyl-phosphate reductase
VPLDRVEAVVLCLPHGEAAQWVADHPGDHKIVDLTADHRPGSGKEGGTVFGLAEWNEALIRESSFIANPGCYPTGVLLSLLPLHEAGVVDTERLTVVNAASGVTGAGRTPKIDLLFGEVFGNYKAYGEGNEHRHLKEIRSLLPEESILFQPHLLPVPRGILETITVPVMEGVRAEDVRDIWMRRYAKESAIRLLERGLPDLSKVLGTDLLALGTCDVARIVPPVVTVVAALDNLGKGAAGQAVQNMNLIFGWPKELGLRLG